METRVVREHRSDLSVRPSWHWRTSRKKRAQTAELVGYTSLPNVASCKLIYQLKQSWNPERTVHSANLFRSIEFVAAGGGYDEWRGAAVAIDVDARRVVESRFRDADDGRDFARGDWDDRGY